MLIRTLKLLYRIWDFPSKGTFSKEVDFALRRAIRIILTSLIGAVVFFLTKMLNLSLYAQLIVVFGWIFIYFILWLLLYEKCD